MRLALILAALLALPGTAEANLKSCQALFKQAPGTLGGVAMTGRKDYEKSRRGAGYMVQFVRGEADVASLYFYDRKQSRFTEKEMAAELSVSTSRIYRLRAEGQNVTDGDVYFDRADPPMRGLFGLAFVHMEFDGRRQQNDYVTLGQVDGCLVKLIYSTQGSRMRANRKFNRVLNELLTYLGN